MNALTYKEVFPLLMNNQIWLGATEFVSDMVFGVPEGTIVKESDLRHFAGTRQNQFPF